MDFDRWVERIYHERDVGRGIATSVAGTVGLITYLYRDDWVVAAFVAVMVFPVGIILASAIHSNWIRSRERSCSKSQVKEVFESLGSEEKAVVQAFVWHGGSVMTWSACNRSGWVSVAGMESLINRDLVHRTVTADGMFEAFALDTHLFDYAQIVLPNEPF